MTQSTDQPPTPRRNFAGAVAAGGMGGLLTLLVVLLETRPQLAEILLDRIVIPWGPQFILALLLIGFLFLLADRYAPRLIDAQTETATALEHLASAVQQSVERDNSFQREQDVLLNHVARQVEAVRRAVDSHHRAVTNRLSALEPAQPQKTPSETPPSRVDSTRAVP